MMSPTIRVKKPRLILCDIEGTTTAITFVKDVLFPLVRQNVHSYLETNWDDNQTKESIALLWQQFLVDQKSITDMPEIDDFSNTSVTESEKKLKLIDSIVKYVLWQMDYDKKTTGLKQLQGNIWRNAYENGTLKGHVYEDVPNKFEEWTLNGIQVAIYSSGSVLAQKLLFGYTSYGDLTKYISDYFDTNVGFKQEIASYKAISSKLNLPVSEILFLTDIVKEARASIAAGIDSIILTREGVQLSEEVINEFKHIDNFEQIYFD